MENRSLALLHETCKLTQLNAIQIGYGPKIHAPAGPISDVVSLALHCMLTLRRVLIGAVLMLVILLLSALVVMRLGVVPVNADGNHSRLEARIMPLVLHASIGRHASGEMNPISVNEENLRAGVSTYKDMCARCHSTPGADPSAYGQSFYPPAPQLVGGMPGYTDSQLFWTIKHGIRNTGMPAWGSMLSDSEIWQLTSLLKNSQDLPPSVEAEWQARKNRSTK